MPVRIAICDDEEIYLSQLSTVLRRLADVDISTFSDGNLLLRQLDAEPDAFDVLCLDIMMDKLDGITLARHINETVDDAIIIYVTNHLDFVQTGYEVRAFRYVLKNQLEQDIPRIFPDIMTELGKRRDNYFSFTHERETKRLKCLEIICLASDKRVINLHHKRGCDRFYGKLDLIESTLAEHGFARCHTSYLVNLSHVEGYTSGFITMSNGMVVPISRSYVARMSGCIPWLKR